MSTTDSVISNYLGTYINVVILPIMLTQQTDKLDIFMSFHFLQKIKYIRPIQSNANESVLHFVPFKSHQLHTCCTI